jgi:hypothetical protein
MALLTNLEPTKSQTTFMSSQYHQTATDKPVDEVMADIPASAGQSTGSRTTSRSERIDESALQNLNVSMLE